MPLVSEAPGWNLRGVRPGDILVLFPLGNVPLKFSQSGDLFPKRGEPRRHIRFLYIWWGVPVENVFGEAASGFKFIRILILTDEGAEGDEGDEGSPKDHARSRGEPIARFS